jgi:hypothetical protein
MSRTVFVYESGKEVSLTTKKSVEELQNMLKSKWFVNLDIEKGEYTFINLEKVAFVKIT